MSSSTVDDICLEIRGFVMEWTRHLPTYEHDRFKADLRGLMTETLQASEAECPGAKIVRIEAAVKKATS